MINHETAAFTKKENNDEGGGYLTNEELRDIEGAQKGDKVRLVKKEIKEGKSSGLPEGWSKPGELARDIKQGRPVLLKNGDHTSKVYKAKKQGKSLLIETKTSIYKVEPHEGGPSAEDRDVDSDVENPKPEEIIQKITENPDQFDEKVSYAAERYGDSFELVKNIDGNLFVFSETRNDKAIALVRDEFDEWHARAFHHSGSDKQWKAVPAANPGRQLKGDESDPNNHYVQSNKLAKEVHQAIDQTTHTTTHAFDYMRVIPIRGGGEHLDYPEKNVDFKDDEWAQLREELQQDYDLFMAVSDNDLEGLAPNQPFGQFCRQAVESYEVDPELRRHYDLMVNNFDEERLKNMALAKLEYGRGDQEKMYNLFVESLQEVMRQKRKEINEKLEAADMLPEFNTENLQDTYSKNSGEDEIKIHEFISHSAEGDKIVWSMAKDASGRTYIDNIYPKEASANSYGALDPKCNMGILVYKPLDYDPQTLAIPEENIGSGRGGYTEISSYWEKFTPVQEYKEFLAKHSG